MMTQRPRLASLLELVKGALLAADLAGVAGVAAVAGVAGVAGLCGCAPSVVTVGPGAASGSAERPSEAAGLTAAPSRAATRERLERWRSRIEPMLATTEQALRARTRANLPEDDDTLGLEHKRLVVLVALADLDWRLAQLPKLGEAELALVADGKDLGELLEDTDRRVSALLATRQAELESKKRALDEMLARAQDDVDRLAVLQALEEGGRAKDARHAQVLDAVADQGVLKAFGPSTGKKAGAKDKSKKSRGGAPAAAEEPAEPAPASACPLGDPLCSPFYKAKEERKGRREACRCVPGDPLCSCEDEQGWAGPGGASGQPSGGVAAATVAGTAAPVDEVLPAVRRRLGELAACLPSSLSEAGVRLDVSARLSPDGGLREIRVGPGSEVGPGVSACLGDVLGRVRVTAPGDGSSHLVSFPLWLAPGG
jgi:hypothetical protein